MEELLPLVLQLTNPDQVSELHFCFSAFFTKLVLVVLCPGVQSFVYRYAQGEAFRLLFLPVLRWKPSLYSTVL